jgi:hypothetical protein
LTECIPDLSTRLPETGLFESLFFIRLEWAVVVQY